MGGGVRPRALLASFAAAVALASAGVAASPGAECEGDECQGPAPAPEEIIPATAVVEGPPNPPVRFPKSRHGKQRDGKHKHRGRRASGR